MSVSKITKKAHATDEDINVMMEELRDYRDNDDLTKWEKAFYDNIRASLDHGRDLSELQILKLREIYDEHIN